MMAHILQSLPPMLEAQTEFRDHGINQAAVGIWEENVLIDDLSLSLKWNKMK